MPVLPTLDNTLGALQIGSLVAVFLFGILTLQAHSYYTTFPEDKWPYKTLVCIHPSLSSRYHLIREHYALGRVFVVRRLAFRFPELN